MNHSQKRTLSVFLAGALMFCRGFAAHAFAAESPELQNGVWLAQGSGIKSYYLFADDASGFLCSGNLRQAFTYSQTGSSLGYMLANDHTEVSMALSDRESRITAELSTGETVSLTYLQPYDDSDSKKYYSDGDITQDSNLSQYDAMLLQRFFCESYQMNNVQQTLADLNQDQIVNAADLSLLKQRILSAADRPDPPETPQNPEIQTQVMLDVIEYNQHPEYPTGCESIALYILLQYYDTDVTPAEIIEALPKGPLPYLQDDAYYGANPEKEFVGDPTSNYSYGVFQEPIAKTAEQFREGVCSKKGAALEELWPILSSGHPVVAWYTTNPDRDIIYKNWWYDYETGELIRWPGGEHAVVVCGYDLDEDTITYRDPNTGGSNTLSIELFRKIFDELGGRIVYYEE